MSDDVIENFKVALNASKIAGTMDGIVLSMKVLEKMSREYSDAHLKTPAGRTYLPDHALGATQSAMEIGKVLKDLAGELQKELELNNHRKDSS